MTKDELIARLKMLGAQLNREVSLAGSKEDLALRVAELEEELDDDGITVDEDGGSDTAEAPLAETEQSSGSQGFETGGLVAVKTLATLHIEALDAVKDVPVGIVKPGVVIRVTAEEARVLSASKLVALTFS
ncbi:MULTISPECIES: DNA-packaging protein FI [Citrobacter]|uniref:DNA-packaging protein FI n=1 Tax=Citrobacter TaxID=544 RepID=UPI0023AA7A50|nr:MULTISPECIES: DNA-packaging protein FI [Citrobacter]MDM2956206.1 DNA-packaging protein FI [Citrobacter sp. CK206]WEE19149.1 DNA-packaging protein FI [Citrobacter koseri]